MRIKSLIGRTAFRGLSLLSSIMPKNDKLWLFGAWDGHQYADNSKYLFEYMNEKHAAIQCIWVSKEKEIIEEVKKKGYKAVLSHSIRGILLLLRAAVVFETAGYNDLSYFKFSQSTKEIQLWHGMGFKALQWKDEKGELVFEKNEQNKKFSLFYWMASSELFIKSNIDIMHISAERFTITGFPRNDAFISKPRNQYVEALKEKCGDKKLLIYMPTHRNFGKEGNAHINLNSLQEVDKRLGEHNLVMVYKPHYHELQNFIEYENRFANIILAKEKEAWADVYSYLHYFDLLISDYSSVITDFMCSGKPVIYFPYDLEEYNSGDAGVLDFFYEIPGGPMCYTWEEVIDTAASLLANDTWKEERDHCCRLYHKYNDGGNCERVYLTVKKLLQ